MLYLLKGSGPVVFDFVKDVGWINFGQIAAVAAQIVDATVASQGENPGVQVGESIIVLVGLEPDPSHDLLHQLIGDEFGTSIDGSGRYIVVGAPGTSNDTGAAYVFWLEADGDLNLTWGDSSGFVDTARMSVDFEPTELQAWFSSTDYLYVSVIDENELALGAIAPPPL